MINDLRVILDKGASLEQIIHLRFDVLGMSITELKELLNIDGMSPTLLSELFDVPGMSIVELIKLLKVRDITPSLLLDVLDKNVLSKARLAELKRIVTRIPAMELRRLLNEGDVGTLVARLVIDSNPRLPLSEVNARKILTELAPNGFTPNVAGAGGQGADVVFEGSNSQIFQIEVKSTTSFRGFDSLLRDAVKDQANGGLVFIQVPDGADVSNWIPRFLGNRKGSGEKEAYRNTEVIIYDASGRNLLPRQSIYNP